MKNGKLKIFLLLCITLIVILVYHNVPKKVTVQDEAGLSIIFGEQRVSGSDLEFEDQISFIHSMVNTVHQDYVVGIPIAYSLPRGPIDLVQNGGGLCYDFSRTIEKYLISNGFKTRHVAVYLNEGNFFNTISKKGVYSHSLTEVQTKKGWMIVDSNVKFYALDVSGQTYSYKELNDLEEAPNWKLELDYELISFYMPNTVHVYGLYSRHGGFYKPYNFIPDYNIRELFYNF